MIRHSPSCFSVYHMRYHKGKAQGAFNGHKRQRAMLQILSCLNHIINLRGFPRVLHGLNGLSVFQIPANRQQQQDDEQQNQQDTAEPFLYFFHLDSPSPGEQLLGCS